MNRLQIYNYLSLYSKNILSNNVIVSVLGYIFYRLPILGIPPCQNSNPYLNSPAVKRSLIEAILWYLHPLQKLFKKKLPLNPLAPTYLSL